MGGPAADPGEHRRTPRSASSHRLAGCLEEERTSPRRGWLSQPALALWSPHQPSSTIQHDRHLPSAWPGKLRGVSPGPW